MVLAFELGSGVTWIALAVAFAGGCAVGVAWLRRGPRGPDAKSCAEAAGMAAESGDLEAALAWTRRALERAPDDARYRIHEGIYLGLLGDREGALTAFRRAAARDRTGEAHVQAALLLADDASRTDEALEHLRQALAQAPILLLEVEGLPEMGRLRRHPGYAKLAKAAKAVLEPDRPG